MLSIPQLKNIHGRQARIVAEGAHAMTGERELIHTAKQLWNRFTTLKSVGGDEDLLNEMVAAFPGGISQVGCSNATGIEDHNDPRLLEMAARC